MKKNFLYRFLNTTSRPVWLTIIVVTYIVMQFAFNGMFDFSTSHLKEVSGGYAIPDLSFYYSPGQLHDLFNHFGKSGLNEYMHIQLIDMFYPLVYALLLSGLLFIAYRNSKFYWVIYLPFIASVFDYLENFMLRFLALSYPDFNDGVAHFAAFCTAWKWIFVYISILFVIAGAIKLLIKKGKMMIYE